VNLHYYRIIFHEKIVYFNRERIQERLLISKGSDAFGAFKVTHDNIRFTEAKIFYEIGKETKVIMHFDFMPA
jgi:catalase